MFETFGENQDLVNEYSDSSDQEYEPQSIKNIETVSEDNKDAKSRSRSSSDKSRSNLGRGASEGKALGRTRPRPTQPVQPNF